MTKEQFNIIAITIGHHFWRCKDDKEAYNSGYGCAREILRELKDANTD